MKRVLQQKSPTTALLRNAKACLSAMILSQSDSHSVYQLDYPNRLSPWLKAKQIHRAMAMATERTRKGACI
jgi:hypothetical protein